jgi:hypothetical protein
MVTYERLVIIRAFYFKFYFELGVPPAHAPQLSGCPLYLLRRCVAKGCRFHPSRALHKL